MYQTGLKLDPNWTTDLLQIIQNLKKMYIVFINTLKK